LIATESPVPQDGVPRRSLARLYGAPLTALPADLYIPPDALEVFLDAFEGPLDLLLYLIRRQNFNILDIPMAEITRQYLTYIEEIRNRNLELAAEYLLMAAMLIEIKSRGLLPKPRPEEGAPEEDPRAELARRLIEYEQIRAAALSLDAMPQTGRDFMPAQASWVRDPQIRFPSVAIEELQRAWQEVVKRSKLTTHHRIERAQLSVRDGMTRVLRVLADRPFATFEELFDAAPSLQLAVVTFVALLELVREHMIWVTQAEPFAPIYLRLAVQKG
jgi:segregation and condensation protein A